MYLLGKKGRPKGGCSANESFWYRCRSKSNSAFTVEKGEARLVAALLGNQTRRGRLAIDLRCRQCEEREKRYDKKEEE